jgi:hypothetical protein
MFHLDVRLFACGVRSIYFRLARLSLGYRPAPGSTPTGNFPLEVWRLAREANHAFKAEVPIVCMHCYTLCVFTVYWYVACGY